MVSALLVVAAILQGVAILYGLYLLSLRKGAAGAWLFLLGAMASMFVWRVVTMLHLQPPPFFNPLIAIWGSTCMVAAMFLFGREVSARRQAERERDALLDSERAARVEAEKASRAKDEFLATLSHELRSPLAAILGWCAVLQRTSPTERSEIELGLGVIERNARAQTRLVDDLLDVTRMRSGKMHLSAGIVPLGQPLRAAVQALAPAAAAKLVRLDMEIDGDGPTVLGDRDRLRQVATNLLENAVRFTPAGGRITVVVSERDGMAETRVCDTGEGIDAELLPHVFGRFRQGDSSTTRRHGGLGLGLSIVNHLVRMHGGEVTAQSAGPGHGATFTFTLPVAAAGADPAALDHSPSARPAVGNPLHGLRILLVDDEDDVRGAVARLLEQLGARVDALSSGISIRERIAAGRPQLLIFDLGMPGEDGYSLIRRVRRLPADEGGLTPAISLTAHARNEDRDRALTAGFNEHLPKPVDIPQLVSAILALAAPTAATPRTASVSLGPVLDVPDPAT